jgi:FMN phosphatase YigB (HAD superfamily)
VEGGGSGKRETMMSMSFMVVMAILNMMSLAHGFSTQQHSTRHAKIALCSSQSTDLSFLSFDLDDTFWPTTDVVNIANNKMIVTLHGYGCHDAATDKFLDTTRRIRKTLNGPITYQNLRKLSIKTTLETSPAFELARDVDLHLDDIVDDCYNAWEQQRHLAAEECLFDDAVETMHQLRELYPDTLFAAITNGAGDPLAMPRTLAPFFDFRISGEDEGVFPHRKPAFQIYETALRKNQVLNGNVDGIWCHVGDCLANDVGASADYGAKAIWMCLEDDPDSAAVPPYYSTATAAEMENSACQVAEGQAKVAASITKLSQLPDAIATILQESRVADRTLN